LDRDRRSVSTPACQSAWPAACFGSQTAVRPSDRRPPRFACGQHCRAPEYLDASARKPRSQSPAAHGGRGLSCSIRLRRLVNQAVGGTGKTHELRVARDLEAAHDVGLETVRASVAPHGTCCYAQLGRKRSRTPVHGRFGCALCGQFHQLLDVNLHRRRATRQVGLMPSMPESRQRWRQRATCTRPIPSCSAISLFCGPSAARSKMRERSASRTLVRPERTGLKPLMSSRMGITVNCQRRLWPAYG